MQKIKLTQAGQFLNEGFILPGEFVTTKKACVRAGTAADELAGSYAGGALLIVSARLLFRRRVRKHGFRGEKLFKFNEIWSLALVRMAGWFDYLR